MGATANGDGISLWGEESGLELYSSNQRTALRIC